MMDFRQRLEQSRTIPVDSEAAPEPETQFSCEYFAAERVKSPTCLELRMPNGIRKALPYAYFVELNYDTETGIEILTNRCKVTITGRNLARLFDYLIAYRVRYVQADVGNDTKEDGVFVKAILVEDLTA
jgi:hypothetical protein